MDAIAQLPGTSIPDVLLPTQHVFVPLLRARQSQIEQTPKKTFKFGPTDRHQIDIYYPPAGTSNAPILFFVYGGGFTTGSRTVIPDLCYHNVGSFFAQRGILTAIADYRLAPDTLYPCPVHDVRDAIRFALASPDVDVAGSGADKTRVYVMGHSAGGAHLVTLFLNEDILGEERNVLRGAILSASATESWPPIAVYYGEPESEIDGKTPLGLLRSKSPEKLKQLLPPRLLFLIGENDPPVLTDADATFKKELREKGITDWGSYTMQGHNHISPNFALNSGEGEEWGEMVVKWLKAKI